MRKKNVYLVDSWKDGNRLNSQKHILKEVCLKLFTEGLGLLLPEPVVSTSFSGPSSFHLWGKKGSSTIGILGVLVHDKLKSMPISFFWLGRVVSGLASSNFMFCKEKEGATPCKDNLTLREFQGFSTQHWMLRATLQPCRDWAEHVKNGEENPPKELTLIRCVI